MTATWKQADVFPIVAQIITDIFAREHRTVTHDEIADGLLADAVASRIIDEAQEQQEEKQSKEWLAHNMVAWFSARIPGESEWARRFDRYRIAGKWAYKPNCCADCTGIDANPDHYRGKPVTDARILRCVLYEAFTLAMTLQSLQLKTWPAEVCYHLEVADFDPTEILKQAALLRIRLLYDFLYNEKSKDEFSVSRNFARYGFDGPLDIPDGLVGLQGCGEFSKNSINKFVAHLKKARITKPKCTPQPRFESGRAATVGNAMVILDDVDKFVSRVIAHPDFDKLEDWGKSLLDGFRDAMSRLSAA